MDFDLLNSIANKLNIFKHHINFAYDEHEYCDDIIDIMDNINNIPYKYKHLEYNCMKVITNTSESIDSYLKSVGRNDIDIKYHLNNIFAFFSYIYVPKYATKIKVKPSVDGIINIKSFVTRTLFDWGQISFDGTNFTNNHIITMYVDLFNNLMNIYSNMNLVEKCDVYTYKITEFGLYVIINPYRDF